MNVMLDSDNAAIVDTHLVESIDLSIVMPCLNEAETIKQCIIKAQEGIKNTNLRGEIVIADNGSTDGSVEIATQLGARVVAVAAKGYGSALRGGIEAARGRWIIMGDADDSYDFSSIHGFIEKLREGFALVMGCRLPSGKGTIMPGAMPWKNRWLGNPVLSFLGRTFFKTPIRDFHCGLRAFSKTGYDSLGLKTTGMEFASEMVMKATLKGLPITEVPITLYRDGRSRPPHLRAWRDGWRHLRFMLIYSPRWLFLVPGIVIAMLGLIATIFLCWAPRELFGIAFDVGTLLVAAMSIIAGIQLVSLACFTKVFGIGSGLLPQDRQFSTVFKFLTLERGLAIGVIIFLFGGGLLIRALSIWQSARFGILSYPDNLRMLTPAMTSIIVGLQVISSSFFMSVLGLNTTEHHPPSTDA